MKQCIVRRFWYAAVLTIVGFNLLFTTCLFALDPNKRINQYDIRLYTAKDGLPMNTLRCVYQDSRGYIWIGSQEGLVRFDGRQFKIFDKSHYRGLASNFINDIKEDRHGNLWLATKGGGVSRFDGSAFISFGMHDGLPDNNVNTLCVDDGDTLWVGTERGLIRFHDRKIFRYPDDNVLSELFIYTLAKAADSSILVGSASSFIVGIKKGIIEKYPCQSPTFSFMSLDSTNIGFINQEGGFFSYQDGMLCHKAELAPYQQRFVNKLVRSNLRDNDGNLWFTTEGSGLYRFNGLRLDSLNRDNFTPFGDDFYNCIFKDNEGSLWCTGDAGLLQIKDNKFSTFSRHDGHDLLFAHTVCETHDHKIWLGFRSEGLYMFDPLSHEPMTKISLPQFWQLQSVAPRKANGIWVGMNPNGLYHFTSSGGLHPVRLNPVSEHFLGIYSLIEDSQERLWIGYNGMISSFDGYKFTDYYFAMPSTRSDVISLAETDDGNIWFGTWGLGLYRLNNGQITKDGILPELESDGITALFRDPEGVLWIGSENHGLYRYMDGEYANFNAHSGLFAEKVFAILEDDSTRMWFSSNKGVFYVQKADFAAFAEGRIDRIPCTVFNHLDGMKDAECTGRRVPVAWKSHDGKLWFTTIAGVVCVDPNNMPKNMVKPPVYIEEIVCGDSVYRADQSIRLNSDQRNLEIRYTALSYVVPERVRFRYCLDGADQDWVEAEGRRSAFYTNLRPRRYTFRVIACNNDGVWNEEGAALALTIPPHWWETWWALVAYGLLVFGALALAVRKYYRDREMKADYQRKKEYAERLAELDQAKSNFFANISHELRTPLTILRLPLNELIAGRYSGNLKELYRMMKRHTDRLLVLIEQLLEIARIESGKLVLKTEPMDAVIYFRTLTHAFDSLAQDKGIRLTFQAQTATLPMQLDKDKAEKILTNLIVNAVKFTERGGLIEVTFKAMGNHQFDGAPSEKKYNDGGWMTLSVRDTGIGIAPELLPHIFERFVRGEEAKVRRFEGTGIGLSLARDLAKLHGGEITVESQVGSGTCFSVLLPRGTVAPDERLEGSDFDGDYALLHKSEHEPLVPPPTATRKSKEQMLVLVVEDEPDMRRLIREQLIRHYAVLEAGDGEDGLAKAIQHIPDLIVSDVMMPKMDGMQLCKKVKEDERTSHIPVILLTALARHEHRLEGLETGADDYIVKPFDAYELAVRARNLVENRRKLHRHYSEQTNQRSPAADPHNGKFVEKLTAIVRVHLADEHFSVDDLAAALHWSRRQLYRKVHAVTSLSPDRLIYSVRLDVAKELLESGEYTISEIAYQVGFSNPAHFAKAFRSRYGLAPKEYRSKLKENGKTNGDDVSNGSLKR